MPSRHMRLEFDKLPRAVRERIVELSRTPGDSRVLFAEPGLSGGWFKYVTLVFGLGACVFTLQFLLQRARADVAPWFDREVFGMLAGGVFVVLASVCSFVFQRLYPPPPYKTGQWALSSYLMRLSRGWVELEPLSKLGKPTIVTVLRNGAYSGSRLRLDGWTFHFSSKQAVDQACGKLLAARELFTKALAAKDARALSAMDPFFDCTLSGIWTAPGGIDQADGPRSPLVPGRARAVQWLGSLLAGAAVAALTYVLFSARHTGG